MNEMLNRNIIDEVRSVRAQYGDAYMPCIGIGYSLAPVAGESTTTQNDGATITIDANGGAASHLLITISKYTRNEAGTQTSTDTELDGDDYDTIVEMVDALNAIEGITAFVMHAPSDMALDNDNFVDLAETAIRTDGKYNEVLYKDADQFLDADTDYPVYIRVGLPEVRDSGRITLQRLYGFCTGVTGGLIKIYRDEIGGTKTEMFSYTLAEALTQYINNDANEALTYRGPLLIEVRSDDLSAADFTVVYRSAEW